MKLKFQLKNGAVKTAKLHALGHGLLLIAGLASTLTATAQAPAVPKAAQAPEMRLSGDRITLPIVMVRGYPFVEGSVAGVSGKFMLDTGIELALAVNDHRVPVSDAQAVGEGKFGSGQAYAVRLAPVVKDVQVGGLRYPQITQVKSQDATQLERITPDFIGWIGYRFWEDYAVKLDYRNLQATFYRGAPEEYLLGEKTVAVLPFSVRKLPNIPIMTAQIGDVDVTAAFDTGQDGHLFIDAGTKSRLMQSGVLKPSDQEDNYDISSLKIGDKVFTDIKGVTVHTDAFPAAAPTGLTDKNLITLGYAFLNRYKTVWDSKRKTMYVLER